MSKVVLKLLETATGLPTEYDNKFLEFYDPTYCPDGMPYDGGILLVTSDPNQAMQFPNAAAAVAKWREAFGTREDGQPNRPLSAWTVEVLPLEDARKESQP